MTELVLYLILWLLFITCFLIWIFAVIGSVLGVIIPGTRSNWDNAKLGVLAVVSYLVARRLSDSDDTGSGDQGSGRQDRDRGEEPDQRDGRSIQQLSDEAVLDEVFGEDRSSR